MNSKFIHIKNLMSPGLRGAFYYSLFWFADAAFEPFINVHFNRLGLSGMEIGWLAMFLPLFTLINPPWITRLADKFAIRVRLLTVITLLVAVFILFYSFPHTFIQFLPIAILASIFRCVTGPLADSIIARMASKYEIHYGGMRAWGSLFFSLSSLALGYLWSLVGFHYIFVVSGILFIPTAISAVLLDETPPDHPSNLVKTSFGDAFKSFARDKSLVLLSIATFLVIAAMVMASNFIGIYMESVGGNETYIGALWGISALCEVPVMLYSGKIVRRLGDTTTLFLSCLLFSTGFLGYSISHSPLLLVFFAAVRGFGFGLLFVNTVTIIDRRAPARFSSTYQGIWSAMAGGLAPLLANPLSGWIFDNIGPIPLFMICAAISFVGGLLLLPTYLMWTKPKTELTI